MCHVIVVLQIMVQYCVVDMVRFYEVLERPRPLLWSCLDVVDLN